jgi:hypothetical protein
MNMVSGPFSLLSLAASLAAADDPRRAAVDVDPLRTLDMSLEEDFPDAGDNRNKM